MRSGLFAAATAALAGSVAGQVVKRQSGSLPTIETRGNAFYTAGGERFYVRGVAYQPGGASEAEDPLLDTEALSRDIEQFERLGINTIRIYTIDNSQNHDEAMRMLDEAGIYLALDVNTPYVALNRESPEALHASYNDVYLQSVFATVDMFAGYNNLLLFFSGNEVINDPNNTNAAPYIKAVTRDIKRYINAQVDRQIPVGYSAADVEDNVYTSAVYFACGDDEMARSDFFAFNDYSWCDPSSFTQSGWDQKVELYSNYSLPIFLSEFGCITNTREWNEIAALYSEKMTGVYSGGLVYEYTIEPNGYGLVEVGSNGNIEPNEDFERLMEAYEQTPNPTGDGGARTDTEVPQCPEQTDDWEVSPDNKLPEIPEPALKYIRNGAGEGPGIDEDESSQYAGTPTSTDVDLSDGTTDTDTSEDPESSGDGTSTGSSSSSSSSSSSDSSSSNSNSDSEEDSDNSESGASSLYAGAASLVISFAAAGALLL